MTPRNVHLAAEELGVLVGVEFRAAAEAAASVHAAVCLGDRPINVSHTGVLERNCLWMEVPILA